MSHHAGPYGPSSPYPTVHTQVHTQLYRSSTAHQVIAWIVAVLTLGYMLPWAIAATRNKSNTAVIALINLLLGWSLVGWVVALVMSLNSEPQPVVYVNTAILPPPQPYGQPGYAPYGHPASAPALQPPTQEPGYGYQQPPTGYGYQQPEPTVILPPQDPWNGGRRDDYR